MSGERWRISEPEPDEVAGVPPTMVASISYLWAAMRRRWKLVVALGAVGLTLGVGHALTVTPEATATTTLYLEHPAGTDPASAMQTDLSILRTRTVAERTLKALGLHSPAGVLQDRTTSAATTSSVMTVTVSAATPALALKTVRELASTYLSYRSDQLNSQANAQVNGYRDQITSAQKQVAELTAEYNSLSTGNADQQAAAGDVLSRRSQLSAQVITLQQQADATALTADSVTKASHVLDPAAIVGSSTVRRAVLLGMTGLVGGLAVGTGIVLFGALTSNRLRRREEVALAVGAPVRYAARRIRPGLLHGATAAAEGRQVLIRGIEAADTERQPLVLVTPGRTGLRDATALADLVGLDLHPLDLDAGAEELAERAGRVVLVVTAGCSSAEQLRTTAELLRAAGIEIVFVVLIGTDSTDDSFGRPPTSTTLHAWRAGA